MGHHGVTSDANWRHPSVSSFLGFTAGAIQVQSDKNQSENFMRFLPIHSLICLYVRSPGSTWELCGRTSCPSEVPRVSPTDQEPPQLPQQVALSCSGWGDQIKTTKRQDAGGFFLGRGGAGEAEKKPELIIQELTDYIHGHIKFRQSKCL